MVGLGVTESGCLDVEYILATGGGAGLNPTQIVVGIVYRASVAILRAKFCEDHIPCVIIF